MPGELPPSPESPQGTEAERPSKHPRHDRRANVMPLSRRERARRHAYTITALLLLLILSLVAARFIRVRTRPPAPAWVTPTPDEETKGPVLLSRWQKRSEPPVVPSQTQPPVTMYQPAAGTKTFVGSPDAQKLLSSRISLTKVT